MKAFLIYRRKEGCHKYLVQCPVQSCQTCRGILKWLSMALKGNFEDICCQELFAVKSCQPQAQRSHWCVLCSCAHTQKLLLFCLFWPPLDEEETFSNYFLKYSAKFISQLENFWTTCSFISFNKGVFQESGNCQNVFVFIFSPITKNSRHCQ